jgi:hypothetical protein
MKLFRLFSVLSCVFFMISGLRAQDIVDATTLNGKYMFGYQGWFWAPGDGSGKNWSYHWFRNNDPSAGSLVVDMFPDVREFDPDELFPTKLHYSDNSTVKLYSAYVEKTVIRHFRWMRDYQLDGVWVQRFLSMVNRGETPIFNKVLVNCRKGAETWGRVFVVMYDLSGTSPAKLPTIKTDWMYLVDSLGVTASPRYLRHNGKPLVSIWGLGFTDRALDPDSLRAVIKWFQTDAPARYQATVMGGTQHNWRFLTGSWASMLRSLDIISPWTVGRFKDSASIAFWKTYVMKPDMDTVRKIGKEYLPVVWPGFSWHNLKPSSAMNQIPRLGGKFLWNQIYNAIDVGGTALYGAMFDEVNEGTAMYKVCSRRSMAPKEGYWLTLDADGYDLPSDWYLRLACYGRQMLIGKIPKSRVMPIDPVHPETNWTGVASRGVSPVTRAVAPIVLKNGTAIFVHGFNEPGSIVLFRADGRKIKSGGCLFARGTNRVALFPQGEIAAGVYMLTIRAGGMEIVNKLLAVQ